MIRNLQTGRMPRTRDTLRVAVLIVAVCVFSGCIQDNMSINVKPDGSGTIEETVLVGNGFLEMMQGMSKNMSEEGGDSPATGDVKKDQAKEQPIVTEMMEKAKNNAKDFGEGVRFVSAKPAKTQTASGYTAVYSFDDINGVMLDQNPGKKTPSKNGNKGDDSKDASENDMIKFVFTKGSPAKLAVHMPPPRPAARDEKTKDKQPAADDPNAIEMMKAIFKEMRMSIVLNVEGDIVKSNATYKSGRTVTLIDMDFGKLISDPELLKKINKEQPQSVEEMKKMVKGIEGLKLEFANPVIIDFK